MVRHSRLVELVLTYVHRPMLWLGVLIYAPVAVLCVEAWLKRLGVLAGDPWISIPYPLVLMLFSILALPVMIVVHVKQQLVVDRDRMLPTRGPQFRLAWIGVLLAALLLPALWLTARGQLSFAGVSVIVSLLTLVLWWAHTQSAILYMILFPGWFLLYSPPVLKHWVTLLDGHWPAATTWLFIGGVVGMVAMALRMAMVTEENWDYYRLPHSGRWDHASRMTGQHPEIWRSYARGPIASWFEPSRRLLERAMTRPARSLWDRVQRRRIGVTLGGWATVLWLWGFWLLMMVVPLRYNPMATPIMIVWLVMIPPIVSIKRISSVRLMMSAEMVRPATRKACLTEMGLALSVELMRVWLVIAVAFVVTWMVNERTVVLPLDVWLVVAATGASQVVLAGAGLWLLRFRTVLPAVIAYLVVVEMLFSGAAWLWETRDQVHPVAFGGVIVALVLVGAVVARDARRRWMQTDVA